MEFIKTNPRPSDANESNDCAVRATVIATGKSYYEVHRAYFEKGRQHRKGVMLATIKAVLHDIVEGDIKIFQAAKKPTLFRFLKDNPKGNWVICRRGHAFAVKDGVVYDAHEKQAGSRCRVICAIKVGGNDE